MNVTLDLQRFCEYVLAIETEHALREFAESGGPAAVPPLPFHEPATSEVELSVVMPVWNPDERQLERALNSVAAQEFGDIRCEVVVSDDASTNGVLERVLRRVRRRDVRVHRHPRNIGGMANFNWSIAAARGEWLHMLHQDDWIEPGFYRALLRGDAAGSQAELRFCRTRLRDESAQQVRLMFDEAPVPGVLRQFLERQSISQRVQFAGALFSRRAIEAVGGFDEQIGPAADWDFWARIGSRFQVYYHPGQLATYVLHQDSWSSRGAAGFADARAFQKYRLLLQRMLSYVPASRRRTTARGFLQNMLMRVLDLARRNHQAGLPAASVPAGQALFVGCSVADLWPDVQKVILGA
jgi:glycosyltransferase involved in cell wall biosynthesis